MNRYLIFCCIVFMPLNCLASSNDTFQGAYLGTSRACLSSLLVLNKNEVSIDECRKTSYRVILSESNYIIIELKKPSSECGIKRIKIERDKELRTDSFGVTLYYDTQASSKDGGSYCSYDKVDRFMVKKFIHGKTGKVRQEALHKMNLQMHPDRNKYNEFGLNDKSPAVREIAACFLRGKPDRFVPMLIKVIAYDPNSGVRASAGYSLSHFYTDNGSEGDLHIKPLERNLDTLLIGLKRVETVRSVVDILGNRYTGNSYAPCYMSAKSRKQILKALINQLKTIRKQADDWHKGKASWDNELNEADHEIDIAIENIGKCNLIK
jgi:hypothetical protein